MSCIFNERISLYVHNGNKTKNDSLIYLNVPKVLDIKGYEIDFVKINKYNKLKKKKENQK